MCGGLFKKPKAQTVVQEVQAAPKAVDAPSKNISTPEADVKNTDVVASISGNQSGTESSGRVRLGGKNTNTGGAKVGLRI
ncbi:hypothetical protein HOS22_gp42 [Rhizobium phage RHEph08]|uniref:Uncharacterized protein n=2 Tax=Cuernavacavirus TaxID=2731935 RepID=L7TS19_9CAUD|nr:hypothetical protein HOS22_gp42 [Rhizobium phage RHEph08]YP_009793279.1 hypothetical protein HOS23_gp37 [Rhizobium phage RHEph09]AGC35966.1 hypothetical protein RHEph08_gp042 [Rhizobium phage RHEph08]AGC36020.1 hypothetical protein RHEph09_gp037 [Rhizobium phage RHEph09]